MIPLDNSTAHTKPGRHVGSSARFHARQDDFTITKGYLRRIIDILHQNLQQNQKIRLSTKRRTEWMLFAFVIDRVLLATFISIGVALGFLILFQYAYNPQIAPDLGEFRRIY